jgi:hypothetical protein
MAYPAFAGYNIYPAGFLQVFIEANSGGETWQTLGAISGGVLNISEPTALDSVGRNKTNGAYLFTAKCNMMQASLTEVELLDNICSGANNFLFKLSDAVAITTGSVASAGWIKVTSAQVGCKGKLVCDGTPEDNKHIELEWQGTILKSDANEIALYTPSLIDTAFATDGNSFTFMGIGTYTVAKDGGTSTLTHIKPCGVATVQLDDAGGSSPVTITPITNVKMTYEMLAAEDGLKRFLPCSLAIDIEYECMATLNADLLLLGNMTDQTIKLTITMLDGSVFTLDNLVGIDFNFEVSGDMDKNRCIRFSHKGKVLQATIATIAS